MRRVESDGMWSLMCPNECPGLQDCWGEAFDKLYERYFTMAIHVYAQLAAYSDPMLDGRVALWWRFYITDLDERVLSEYMYVLSFPKHKNVLTSEINFVH